MLKKFGKQKYELKVRAFFSPLLTSLSCNIGGDSLSTSGNLKFNITTCVIGIVCICMVLLT